MVAPTPGDSSHFMAGHSSLSKCCGVIDPRTPPLSLFLPLPASPPSLLGHFTLAYAVMHLIAQHLARANSSKT